MLIGEVAAQSGISARMLRHYDSIGLVSPSGRTHGGYRQYEDDDLRSLFHVEGLRSLGLTLQEVAEVLEDLSFSPAAMVEELVPRTHERLAREQELLRRLDEVQASGPATYRGDRPPGAVTVGSVFGGAGHPPATRGRYAATRLDDQRVLAAYLSARGSFVSDTVFSFRDGVIDTLDLHHDGRDYISKGGR